jgi:hypothetical protein
MSLESVSVNRLPMTAECLYGLMRRPSGESHNYHSEVVPFRKLWTEYRAGFNNMLQAVDGSFYAVANFNLARVEPPWCRKAFNMFDMRIARLLLGKHWSKKPDIERIHWIAVPERARFLHYNVILSVQSNSKSNSL